MNHVEVEDALNASVADLFAPRSPFARSGAR